MYGETVKKTRRIISLKICKLSCK